MLSSIVPELLSTHTKTSVPSFALADAPAPLAVLRSAFALFETLSAIPVAARGDGTALSLRFAEESVTRAPPFVRPILQRFLDAFRDDLRLFEERAAILARDEPSRAIEAWSGLELRYSACARMENHPLALVAGLHKDDYYRVAERAGVGPLSCGVFIEHGDFPRCALGRLVCVNLGGGFDGPKEAISLRRTRKHELLHAVFLRLHGTSSGESAGEDDLDAITARARQRAWKELVAYIGTGDTRPEPAKLGLPEPGRECAFYRRPDNHALALRQALDNVRAEAEEYWRAGASFGCTSLLDAVELETCLLLLTPLSKSEQIRTFLPSPGPILKPSLEGA